MHRITLRRLTCGANLLACASKRVDSDDDSNHQAEKIKTPATSKLSRILRIVRCSNDREIDQNTASKKRSFLNWKSRRNNSPKSDKNAGLDKGFSMYGRRKPRATNSGEKEIKKVKRRKKRKERNATLSRARRRVKEKYEWKTNDRRQGHQGEMSGSWSAPGIYEMSHKKRGAEEIPRHGKHSKHRRDKRKQDELEQKRCKSSDRKKESNSSQRKNESKPKRKHSRRLKKPPVEGVQSDCHGDEDWSGKWHERGGMGKDHQQGNREYSKDRNGRKRKSGQRHGKRDETVNRFSNASYLDGQAFINPYHSPYVDPSPFETWTTSLHQIEAWQERCSADIDSARRKIEHRFNRLEKKLEIQSSEEWNESLHAEDTKELPKEEYERLFDRVTDECHAILISHREMLDNVTEEIRAEVQAGFDRIEEKLALISDSINIECRSIQKSGTKPCEKKCGLKVRVGSTECHWSGGQHNSDVHSTSVELTPQNGATVASRVSQSDALDAREEPRDLNREGAQIEDTSATQQVRHQKELQDLERRYTARAKMEQAVLCSRIRELEHLLMVTRAGNTTCYV